MGKFQFGDYAYFFVNVAVTRDNGGEYWAIVKIQVQMTFDDGGILLIDGRSLDDKDALTKAEAERHELFLKANMILTNTFSL